MFNKAKKISSMLILAVLLVIFGLTALPVFADECGVLAVFGLGADDRAAAGPEEADAVLMILERT